MWTFLKYSKRLKFSWRSKNDCVHVCSQYKALGSVSCCIPSKNAPCLGRRRQMVAGGDAREGRAACSFQVSRTEVADGSCVLTDPRRPSVGELCLRCCFSLSLRPGLKVGKQSPSSETQGESPVRPREREASLGRSLKQASLAKSIRRETLHLPFWSLVCTVQFELGGFSDLSLF